MPAAKTVKKSANSSPKAEIERLPTPDEAGAAFVPALAEGLKRPRALLAGVRRTPPSFFIWREELRASAWLWPCGGRPCSIANGMETRPAWRVRAACVWGRTCLPTSCCWTVGAGSIKIDEVRALRPLLGEPPRFGRKRVIVMAEAQALGIEAANSLLKVLEDPCPDTCFVFTAPQRERLLPTLVSRGWVVTLPWPDPAAAPSEACANGRRLWRCFWSGARLV